MHQVYLSIGTNIGDRKVNVRNALCLLSDYCNIIQISKAYRTKPYGYLIQPDFINLAVKIETDSEPEVLLKNMHIIENKLVRQRKIKWGPRTIDLDILFFDDMIYKSKSLIIPHIDIQNRLFVLRPMMDIDPGLIHPVLKKSMADLFDIVVQKDDIMK